MSADGPNAPEVGAETRASDPDHTDRTVEHPEQSEAFRSFVSGRLHDDDPDVRPGWSRLAIASLVSGVVGFLWPVGLALSIAALVRIRRTRQTGRWAALVGLALSAIWAVAAGMSMFFGDGISGDQHVRTVSGYDLKVGDCFGLQPSEAVLAREVMAVPCSQLHHGEVFGLADMGDAVYGGANDRAAGAGEACAALAADYLPRERTAAASLRIDFLLPQGNSVVVRTHRTVICAFVDRATGWTGMLRDGVPTPKQ